MNPVLLIFIFTGSVWASEVKLSIISSFKNGMNDIGIGSKVELQDLKLNQKINTIFLGLMSNHEALGDEVLLMNEKDGKVLMLDSEAVKSNVIKKKMQTIISPFDQSGETCAAYALFHFWRQFSENHPSASPLLLSTMNVESGRMKFLEESITTYYMSRVSYLRTVMKKYALRFGLKCREFNFKEPKKAIDFIVNKTSNARPVLIEFNLGPDMDESDHVITDYETNFEADPRLWFPRKRGEKNAGGHAIVAVGSFEYQGHSNALVLDSNWTEARVWNLNKYIDSKTAMDEISFHTCE